MCRLVAPTASPCSRRFFSTFEAGTQLGAPPLFTGAESDHRIEIGERLIGGGA